MFSCSLLSLLILFGCLFSLLCLFFCSRCRTFLFPLASLLFLLLLLLLLLFLLLLELLLFVIVVVVVVVFFFLLFFFLFFLFFLFFSFFLFLFFFLFSLLSLFFLLLLLLLLLPLLLPFFFVLPPLPLPPPPPLLLRSSSSSSFSSASSSSSASLSSSSLFHFCCCRRRRWCFSSSSSFSPCAVRHNFATNRNRQGALRARGCAARRQVGRAGARRHEERHPRPPHRAVGAEKKSRLQAPTTLFQRESPPTAGCVMRARPVLRRRYQTCHATSCLARLPIVFDLWPVGLLGCCVVAPLNVTNVHAFWMAARRRGAQALYSRVSEFVRLPLLEPSLLCLLMRSTGMG